ncbi:hypothetical protein [Pararhizobium gei]|uniref:hypothetical protein n=1 Tax=Pararhizobium gei TaxID=1395951 RepID=UPI0023DC46C4|nr:hypothetical protein [Rhizobium gei]
MEQSDIATLQQMLDEINAHSSESLDQFAERLLQLRDELKFDDADWYHDFTQHLATLDSASTFHPANNLERHQLSAATQQAIFQINYLIRAKLS